MIIIKPYASQFVNYLETTLRRSPRTCAEYAKDLTALALWSASVSTPLPLLDITSSVVEMWVDAMSRDNLSAATIRRRVSVLRAFFRWARLRCLTESDPTRDILTPRIPVVVKRDPDVELLRDFVRVPSINPRRNRLQAIVALMLCAGLRLAEVLALDASDLDFEQCLINVNGKGRKQRLVAISANAAIVLHSYLGASVGPLFPEVSEVDVRFQMIHTIRKNGQGVNPHSIRHLYASLCASSGMPLHVLSRQLGHASVKTTERYIANNYAEAQRAADRYAPDL